MNVEVIWKDPQIIMIRNLLFEHECDSLTSTLADDLRNWDSYNDAAKRTTLFEKWTDVRVMKK